MNRKPAVSLNSAVKSNGATIAIWNAPASGYNTMVIVLRCGNRLITVVMKALGGWTYSTSSTGLIQVYLTQEFFEKSLF